MQSVDGVKCAIAAWWRPCGLTAGAKLQRDQG